MFVGRHFELEQLNNAYNSGDLELGRMLLMQRSAVAQKAV